VIAALAALNAGAALVAQNAGSAPPAPTYVSLAELEYPGRRSGS